MSSNGENHGERKNSNYEAGYSGSSVVWEDFNRASQQGKFEMFCQLRKRMSNDSDHQLVRDFDRMQSALHNNTSFVYTVSSESECLTIVTDGLSSTVSLSSSLSTSAKRSLRNYAQRLRLNVTN